MRHEKDESSSPDDVVEDLAGRRHALPKRGELPRVLVLTPVKNAASHLDRFFANLAKLDYPKELISVGLLDSDSDDKPSEAMLESVRRAAASSRQVARFLEQEGLYVSSGSGDGASTDAAGARTGNSTSGAARRARPSGTLAVMLAHVPKLLSERYRRVTVIRHDFGLKLAREARHGQAAQLARRAVMARSRNHLLASALREDDQFVLWVDSDLESYSPSTLLRLLGSGKQLVVPNCVMTPRGRSYDLNSWRLDDDGLGSNATVEGVRAAHDSHHAALVKAGTPHLLQLEGYGKTGHLYLHHLREREFDDQVVRLDAVGGAMLLVDAELHRQGLVFPPFVYRHRIETEGLSMMALDMGVLVSGEAAWAFYAVES